jgi:hypothetical protein
MSIFFGRYWGFFSWADAFYFFFFPSEVDDGADWVFDDVGISIGVATTFSQSEASRSWYARRFQPLELPSPAISSFQWKDVLQVNF